MGLDRITYNGYQFPDNSNFSVTEQYPEDDSGRVVVATRFLLRVQTIICNENPIVSGGTPDYSDPAYDCGAVVHLARQRLSKPGQALKIEHDGFAPRLEINPFQTGGGIRDVAWGPHPRILQWTPIGHTASCEVVWECEFSVPICDGRFQAPKFSGLSSLSYGITYNIDSRGYTTRTISGALEIALTRSTTNPRALVDSVDNYRNALTVTKPANFQREVSWNITPDKRRAEFTIVDKEISSPNAWPPGVVNIQATHRVGWNRSSLSRMANTISATIEMAPDQFKARAWLIFRDIVNTRLQYASLAFSPGDNFPQTVFLNSLDVVEELYENKVSFQLSYYFLCVADLRRIFEMTGLFQPTAFPNVGVPPWESWDQSIKHLQPFRGEGTDRGVAQLEHDWRNEKLIDLCDQVTVGQSTPPTRPPQPPLIYAGPGFTFQNKQPPPRQSWIKYDAMLAYKSDSGSRRAITIGPNDVKSKRFSPEDPEIDGTSVGQSSGSIKRFIEDNAGFKKMVFSGYAERAGFPIPEPGVMKINGKWLRPIGDLEFRSKFMGYYFGLPKYGASWRQEYMLDWIPDKVKAEFEPGIDDANANEPVTDGFAGPLPP